jgi:hypothetical protein
MKVSLLFVAGLAIAMFSIAPANAAGASSARSDDAEVGCSWSGTFATACRNVGNYKTFAECTQASLKLGWNTKEAHWHCSSLKLQ